MRPVIIVLLLFVYTIKCQDTTTVAPVESSISCYACGLEEIDPEKDVPGSYGDARKEDTYKAGQKMYNHTCDIADNLGLDEKWVRKCPPGVKSCFWAKGNYKYQRKRLRDF